MSMTRNDVKNAIIERLEYTAGKGDCVNFTILCWYIEGPHHYLREVVAEMKNEGTIAACKAGWLTVVKK